VFEVECSILVPDEGERITIGGQGTVIRLDAFDDDWSGMFDEIDAAFEDPSHPLEYLIIEVESFQGVRGLPHMAFIRRLKSAWMKENRTSELSRLNEERLDEVNLLRDTVFKLNSGRPTVLITGVKNKVGSVITVSRHNRVRINDAHFEFLKKVLVRPEWRSGFRNARFSRDYYCIKDPGSGSRDLVIHEQFANVREGEAEIELKELVDLAIRHTIDPVEVFRQWRSSLKCDQLNTPKVGKPSLVYIWECLLAHAEDPASVDINDDLIMWFEILFLEVTGFSNIQGTV
jgi:hypothetical protein